MARVCAVYHSFLWAEGLEFRVFLWNYNLQTYSAYLNRHPPQPLSLKKPWNIQEPCHSSSSRSDIEIIEIDSYRFL